MNFQPFVKIFQCKLLTRDTVFTARASMDNILGQIRKKCSQEDTFEVGIALQDHVTLV